VTHSPTVAASLLGHAADVFLIGGRLFKHSAVACGAAAVEVANGISADVFFLGVTGVHATAGLTTGDPEEAAMKRALAGRAGETYVLASEEKIGTASRYAVLPFDEIAGVVTDTDAGDPTLRDLADRGVTLILAA
jgi:DeoR/GlpR family transcriptional regulator of sugar metabolism